MANKRSPLKILQCDDMVIWNIPKRMLTGLKNSRKSPWATGTVTESIIPDARFENLVKNIENNTLIQMLEPLSLPPPPPPPASPTIEEEEEEMNSSMADMMDSEEEDEEDEEDEDDINELFGDDAAGPVGESEDEEEEEAVKKRHYLEEKPKKTSSPSNVNKRRRIDKKIVNRIKAKTITPLPPPPPSSSSSNGTSTKINVPPMVKEWITDWVNGAKDGSIGLVPPSYKNLKNLDCFNAPVEEIISKMTADPTGTLASICHFSRFVRQRIKKIALSL